MSSLTPLSLPFALICAYPDGREVVVLVQTLEEHVEHGNVPDSPVTLPGKAPLAFLSAGTLLPNKGDMSFVTLLPGPGNLPAGTLLPCLGNMPAGTLLPGRGNMPAGNNFARSR